jgi:hypothetical protein
MIEGIPEPLEAVTMFSVNELFDTEPIAFYELVEIARDPNHKPFGNAGEKLKKLSLLQENGEMHSAVREIVLAHTSGEGLDLTLR